MTTHTSFKAAVISLKETLERFSAIESRLVKPDNVAAEILSLNFRVFERFGDDQVQSDYAHFTCQYLDNIHDRKKRIKVTDRWNDENLYHESIMSMLKLKIHDEIEMNGQSILSRRFKTVNDSCISMMQIQFRQNALVVNATFSSSDIDVLPKDVMFIQKLSRDIVNFCVENRYIHEEEIPGIIQYDINITNLHMYKD